MMAKLASGGQRDAMRGPLIDEGVGFGEDALLFVSRKRALGGKIQRRASCGSCSNGIRGIPVCYATICGIRFPYTSVSRMLRPLKR